MDSDDVITLENKGQTGVARRQLFDALFESTCKDLLRFISFKISSPDVADDVAADTYFKYWTKLNQGVEIQNPRAFLYTIANGLIIDYYRLKKPSRLIEGTEYEWEHSPEEKYEADERYAHLLELVRSLRPAYRDVVTLHYVEGFEIHEIASILNETENNVRVRLHRALSKLRAVSV